MKRAVRHPRRPARRARPTARSRDEVAVVGLGYVGVTVAAAFADAGVQVLGIEKRREVVDLLRRGRCHIFEPGIEAVLRRTIGKRLHVVADWPDELPRTVVICVSTPANLRTRTPDLRNITDTADEIAQRLPPDGVVIVRSTVPVGTSRKLILDRVRRAKPEAGLAFCPERTVQGAALMELRMLPQVIGAIDERSARQATRLFRKLTPQVVLVDRPETAEMVKLVNNCHTDLLYAFGNEIALLAQTHGVDPLQVIRGANEHYTVRSDGVAVVRPRIAMPGYVGGACLSKDPYLLLQSLGRRPPDRSLVFAVRELNESMPLRAAADVLRLLRGAGKDPARCRVLVCGFAYKGRPETDDLRGTPATPFVEALRAKVGRLLGHDYKVRAQDIAAFGVAPVRLEAGLHRADAVVLLNDHPRYARDLTVRRLASTAKPVVLYDSWRILRGTKLPDLPHVRYAGLGWAR